MSAHTIWSRHAMRSVAIATTAEGYTYGIAYFAEVWFRFEGGRLYCHCRPSPLDATAIMERRGN